MLNAENYTIKRDKKDSNAVNYRFLLEEGMNYAAGYSGKVWTNFNHSDPGVTILQNLCYALTELGYKTALPMKDLLTEADGKIRYKDHFFLPENALTIMPVTEGDFRKLLMNASMLIKQVYFAPVVSGAMHIARQPLIEINPFYSGKVSQAGLCKKVNALLNQYTNLGSVFTDAQCLSQREVALRGDIYLAESASVEKIIAHAFLGLNNVFSVIPEYSSYSELIKKGENPAELLTGPFLDGGYIADSDLSERKLLISIEEITSTLLQFAGVEYVEAFAFTGTVSQKKITLKAEEAALISIFQLLPSNDGLRFFKGGKQLGSVDINKLNQYLKQLMPGQEKQNLAELLPGGEYKHISHYYSFQHQFPAAYGLTDVKGVDAESAVVLQLKGYLMFYDQLMSDYLAQLEALPAVFSFRSGRNRENVVSSTYFTQSIYQVPGARFLLKEAESFVTDANASKSNATNWDLYQKDPRNPYSEILQEGKVPDTQNLERKVNILSHLLARVGQKYPKASLRYTNPLYGDERSDKADHLSESLLHFEEYSANKARGYYQSVLDNKFVSGFERILNSRIGIVSHYRGIIDKILPELDISDSALTITLNGEIIFGRDSLLKDLGRKKQETNQVKVLRSGEEVLAIDLGSSFKNRVPELPVVLSIVKDQLWILDRLVTRQEGFILIDHARLLKSLDLSFGFRKEMGKPYSFEEFSEILTALQNGLKPKKHKIKGVYSIYVRIRKKTCVLFENLKDAVIADQLIKALSDTRIKRPSELVLYAGCDSGKIVIKQETLHTVTACFPSWVPMLQQLSFQQYLVNQMAEIAPAFLKVEALLLDAREMKILMKSYRKWIRKIKLEYNRPDYHISARLQKELQYQAFLILKEFVVK